MPGCTMAVKYTMTGERVFAFTFTVAHGIWGRKVMRKCGNSENRGQRSNVREQKTENRKQRLGTKRFQVSVVRFKGSKVR